MSISYKNVRLKIPIDIHAALKSQAALCDKTLSDSILDILNTVTTKVCGRMRGATSRVQIIKDSAIALKTSGSTYASIARQFGISRQRLNQILNPNKTRARVRVNTAKLNGIIKPPKVCDVCGKTGVIEAHHRDYDKPLDVTWICKKCHSLEHKKK